MSSVPNLNRIFQRKDLNSLKYEDDYSFLIKNTERRLRHIRSIRIRNIKLTEFQVSENWKANRETNSNSSIIKKRIVEFSNNTIDKQQKSDQDDGKLSNNDRHGSISIPRSKGLNRKLTKSFTDLTHASSMFELKKEKPKLSFNDPEITSNDKAGDLIEHAVAPPPPPPPPVVSNDGGNSYDNDMPEAEEVNNEAYYNANTNKISSFDSKEMILGLSDPIERQLRLQQINKKSFVSSFISLHEIFSDSPFFVSEIQKDTMNPDFQEFDFKNINSVSNIKSLTLKVWSKSMIGSELRNKWKLLMDINFKLSFMVYIGKDIDLINKTFINTDNLLIIELSDDSYYIILPEFETIEEEYYFTDLIIKSRKFSQQEYYNHLHHNLERTATYDQIMKLNNLQYCIKDLQFSNNSLREKIEIGLSKKNKFENYKIEVEVNLKNLEPILIENKKRNEIIGKRIEFLKNLIHEKQAKIKKIEENHQDNNNDGELNSEKLIIQTDKMLKKLEIVKNGIQIERSRISNILETIFPINPIYNKTYEFEIFGLTLPLSFNNKYIITKSRSTEIAALLCYIVQLVKALALYLDIPLRYPIEAFGCHSYIIDPISNLKSNVSRVYPLWIKENIMYRFEYGLLLLQKNVEQLMESYGLKTVDGGRNILGNLKILLICLSSLGNGNNKILRNNSNNSNNNTATMGSIISNIDINNGGNNNSLRKDSFNSYLSNSLNSNSFKNAISFTSPSSGLGISANASGNKITNGKGDGGYHGTGYDDTNSTNGGAGFDDYNNVDDDEDDDDDGSGLNLDEINDLSPNLPHPYRNSSKLFSNGTRNVTATNNGRKSSVNSISTSITTTAPAQATIYDDIYNEAELNSKLLNRSMFKVRKKLSSLTLQ